VAGTDITSSDSASGRAVTIDVQLREAGVDAGQPAPAVRMATALFCYSLVARPQGRRGAIKPELLAALLEPGAGTASTPFPAAEEVFNQLTAEDGLGALEVMTPTVGPSRYWLTIKQTLRMYPNAAQQLVQPWERAIRAVFEPDYKTLRRATGHASAPVTTDAMIGAAKARLTAVTALARGEVIDAALIQARDSHLLPTPTTPPGSQSSPPSHRRASPRCTNGSPAKTPSTTAAVTCCQPSGWRSSTRSAPSACAGNGPARPGQAPRHSASPKGRYLTRPAERKGKLTEGPAAPPAVVRRS
jgi:hypothetical protein